MAAYNVVAIASYQLVSHLLNEQIKKDKKAANGERIAKAKSEAEVWKIISVITFLITHL